ncbi:hypothetical protein ABT202_28975 [Streptomyces sp900105245]|uniref:hypothetical protein n=1 Tax=Streptomyces sp. 900105245 TaxID=3154379 RepID=UPI00332EB127
MNVDSSPPRAEVDTGERDGLTSSKRQELAALRRENRRLRGHGFLREGDPVTVHPFIEVEKQAGRSVKRACEMLEVSRAAFYPRRAATPGHRAVRDAELVEQITAVHEQSRGTYGGPAHPRRTPMRGHYVRP